MKTVHIKISLGAICAVGMVNLGKFGIRGGKFGVFSVYIEIVCTKKIIFCAGSANAGKFGITVNEELDFSFSPPTVRFYAPMKIGSDINTVAIDMLKYCVWLFLFCRRNFDNTFA